MDLTAPARDIEEIVAAFAAVEGTELAQMKELWRARNFSFIHEARPKDVIPSFYAQGLFSSALSHIVEEGTSIFWKLGGLYVLYTLHGTQQQESSSFRIYLSLEELEALHALVKEIKRMRLKTAFKVVRKMFNDNSFLFGSVSANQKRIAGTVARLVRQANARVQQARARLFTDVPVEKHFLGQGQLGLGQGQPGLGQELGLQEVAKLTKEYADAKQRALSWPRSGGGRAGEQEQEELAMVVVPVPVPEAIGSSQQTLAGDLIKEAEDWDARICDFLITAQQQQQQHNGVPRLESRALQGDEVGGNGKKQKTLSEYERELREQEKLSDFERELVEQLDNDD